MPICTVSTVTVLMIRNVQLVYPHYSCLNRKHIAVSVEVCRTNIIVERYRVWFRHISLRVLRMYGEAAKKTTVPLPEYDYHNHMVTSTILYAWAENNADIYGNYRDNYIYASDTSLMFSLCIHFIRVNTWQMRAFIKLVNETFYSSRIYTKETDAWSIHRSVLRFWNVTIRPHCRRPLIAHGKRKVHRLFAKRKKRNDNKRALWPARFDSAIRDRYWRIGACIDARLYPSSRVPPSRTIPRDTRLQCVTRVSDGGKFAGAVCLLAAKSRWRWKELTPRKKPRFWSTVINGVLLAT